MIKSTAQGSKNTGSQPVQAKTRKRVKAKIKPSIVAVYASTFILIIAMVFIGYNEPKNSSSVANTGNVNILNTENKTSVDDVVATSVAASVAQSANLPIATSIANLAISVQTKSEFTQTDGTNVEKPQLIEVDNTNRSVTSYIVKVGDTVDSLAAQFNISKETIKWANNLTSDTLIIGSSLKIVPVNGVIYTVKAGDTVDSIATKYSVDKTRLILYNDLDVNNQVVVGSTIILPSANLPSNERPGYVAPVVNNYYYSGDGTGFGGKTWYISTGTPDNGLYSHGNCTLYAYNRRKQLGLPVGDHWGNAGSWATRAAAEGLQVDHSPSAGSIMTSSGHVAIVEEVLANGDIRISEMNTFVAGGGYNIVSGRIMIAGNTGQYWYIH